MPSGNLKGCVHRELRYDTAYALQRRVMEVLTTGQERVFSQGVGHYWTPHSGRNFIPSAAAALNIKKTDRDMLGGWAAQESDQYNRVAKVRIQTIQARVAATFADRTTSDPLLEADALEDFSTVTPASTSQLHTHSVKSGNTLRRFLLVATGLTHEADFRGALHEKWSQQNDVDYELVYYDLSRKLNFFEVLLLLEHVRAGFFEAVHLVPPAHTWSRVRHSSPDQPPLRSRDHPLGLTGLSPQLQAKVDQSNREIEIVTWLLEQATLCSERTVGVLLIFPEDLGGHEHTGPATIWDNMHLRELDGACEVQRGAAFLCQIASTEYRRPLGLLSNLAWVKAQMVPGWPRLYKSDQYLLYDGPLPDRCQCAVRHAPMRGTWDQESFNSSHSTGFGEQFWHCCSNQFQPCARHAPLRDGALPGSSSSSPSLFSSLFSFQNWSGSAYSLYSHWSSCTLTRAILADYAGPTSAAEFFGSWNFGDYFKFCRVTSPGRVSLDSSQTGILCCPSPSRDAGTNLNMARTTSPSLTTSMNAGTVLGMARTASSSQTPGTTEGPLVTSSPRGDGWRTHGGCGSAGKGSLHQARLLGSFRFP